MKNTTIPSPFQHVLGSLIVFAGDVFALSATFAAAVFVRNLFGGDADVAKFLSYLPFLFVVPIVNAFNQLYSSPRPLPHEELRGLAIAVSLAYLLMSGAFFLGQSGLMISRLALLGGWCASLITIPATRYAVRRLWADRDWWGVPAVVFGETRQVASVACGLLPARDTGLRPVAVSGDAGDTNLRSLPDEASLQAFSTRYPGAVALVALPSAGEESPESQAFVENAKRHFRTVILLPSGWLGHELPLYFRSVGIGDSVGFKLRQNLLDVRRLAFKRVIDVVVGGLGGLVILPFLVIIAIGIMIESPGNPFFRQERIGRHGRLLRILKFRTMVPDAEAKLAGYLASSQELRQEWNESQKLKNDPRVTRLGGWLRKTSLDELPQLWNVLWGEMSLVGPRPIVQDEIVRYGKTFQSYTQVRPGMTGLWQVSGRSETGYGLRVRLDHFYISNWSIWLDILILLRTVPVLFSRKGAY